MTKKTVITYGTFDLFHEGHKRILERAKSLGNFLIVGVTAEAYDHGRGKLNVKQSLMERLDNVRRSGLADKLIIEEYEGQKINDIQRYDVDIFTLGSDWEGKFDYLSQYCEVTYLERTRGVSSTELRNKENGIVKIGIVGTGRIAERFVPEARFVSGVTIHNVYSRKVTSASAFAKNHELPHFEENFQHLLESVDAVYIATPHETHYDYAAAALESGCHVLCEKPLTLSSNQTRRLFDLAEEKELVIFEAIKTAYSPGFSRLTAIARSGLIGDIVDVDATFTKLESKDSRELSDRAHGGSFTELASYPLLAIFRLLGNDFKKVNFFSKKDQDTGLDIFTKATLEYREASATMKVGLGAKSEGGLVISGTQGYIYVPAPWWKTEYFEIRHENPADNRKFYFKFDGDGLRYEIAYFLQAISNNSSSMEHILKSDSIAIAGLIEDFISDREIP
jgi:choline-phosphate cytidylyltransferase